MKIGRVMKKLPLVCAVAFATASSSYGKETVGLTEDGVPKSTIIIAKKAKKVAKFAAKELQTHVKEISGAQIPIVTDDQKVTGNRILVGESLETKKLGLDEKDFKKQESLIKFFPHAIVLMGKDEDDTGDFEYDYLKNRRMVNWPSIYDSMGTMYAVYDFLRDYCGVKWINFTDYGTVIPQNKTLIVSGDEKRNCPFMSYRGGTVSTIHCKANGSYCYWPEKTEEAKKYDNHAFAMMYETLKPQEIPSTKYAQYMLFLYRMKLGGEKCVSNHSFYNFYERFWKKMNDNFEAYKPEYFAKGYGGDNPPQLCYSNPETIKQVVKDIRHYFDNGGYMKNYRGLNKGYHWGENFYCLEPMDNNSFCKCDECAKQYEMDRIDENSEHSTYWFNFVNKVAKEIKKSHPDKRISALAYQSHEGLPTNSKLEDNVVVHFCISANRNPASDAKLLKEQLERLVEWDRKEDVPMYLWLYNCFPLQMANNGNFHCFPGHIAHELQRQFGIYKKHKIKGIFNCGVNGEVDNYVLYRLMVDPAQDVDKILVDYFSAYGEAGVPLRKMYELIEKRYCDQRLYPKKPNGGEFSGHQSVDVAWKYLGDVATMKKLQTYMDSAYKLAKTEQEKHLVRLWDESLWSYMKKGREAYVERTSAPVPEYDAPLVDKADGDVNRVDWATAVSLGDKWYKNGGDTPARAKLSGKICHDEKYLYLELVDQVDPKKLIAAPKVACYDVWEVVVSGQRAQPCRQYLIGPTAMTRGLSHGEVNWRQRVESTEYTKDSFGLKATSDTSGSKWIVRCSFPLSDIIEKPVHSGDDLCLNIIRVSNPRLMNEEWCAVDTLVPYTSVKDVDRLARIHLSK